MQTVKITVFTQHAQYNISLGNTNQGAVLNFHPNEGLLRASLRVFQIVRKWRHNSRTNSRSDTGEVANETGDKKLCMSIQCFNFNVTDLVKVRSNTKIWALYRMGFETLSRASFVKGNCSPFQYVILSELAVL